MLYFLFFTDHKIGPHFEQSVTPLLLLLVVELLYIVFLMLLAHILIYTLLAFWSIVL